MMDAVMSSFNEQWRSYYRGQSTTELRVLMKF
jgi:tagatose-1,6-bisphosphate aldolase non-catalytic subunit AgaZ/GatZ